MKVYLNLAVCLVALAFVSLNEGTYFPSWDSLDARPLPKWFDEAKVGIFLHWGVFSVPSFKEWFWYGWVHNDPSVVEFMKKNYPPDFTYADFGPLFRAELYNTDELAEIFQSSGAKYVVLTSKHHEGFTNWPSNYSWNWNSMDVGPKRDLVGELAKSIRSKTDIHFGLYHSMFEWFNSLYLKDKESNFQTQIFSLGKTLPELFEIVNTYKPDVVWSDGAFEAPDRYWNSTEFLAWLYNESPVKDTVVVNDRWSIDSMCKHGGFITCGDHYNPGVLQKRKFENCMTLDTGSWGFRRTATFKDYITIETLLYELSSTISCGGNVLINAGIRSDGKIDPIMEERFRQLGAWLKINGEAVYASHPWVFQNDSLTPRIWYTSKNVGNEIVVYAFVHEWPSKNILTLGAPTATPDTVVTMLGYKEKFLWNPHSTGKGMDIVFPFIPVTKIPSTSAWVLKFEKLGQH